MKKRERIHVYEPRVHHVFGAKNGSLIRVMMELVGAHGFPRNRGSVDILARPEKLISFFDVYQGGKCGISIL